ncbi:Ig-like domain-containing protein [Variovorax terrae]|uniref:Ig-like domain-containing protein n=1 Tax=Variovorax terrae TaxID=2923278 RepID=A0A9X2ARI5_9BURK|nr:Ig-like domain-containing protein [Variovorax terrae]MCJ0765652.1 Ig-like domain-containing protein [Variovorax terrae]
MNHLKNRHLLALALSLGLTACGGGSDGLAPFGPVSSTPANGATGVARNVQPSATFNQSLNAASITATTAQLLSPLGLPLPVTLSASGAVLSMAPVAAALPGGTTYTLALAAGLQSASGAVLGTALSSTFSTVAQQWSGVAQVSALPSAGHAFASSVVADAAGNLTLAWYQDNGTRTVVNASRYANGAWSAPVQVDNPAATGNAVNPSLVADAAGNVTAAWQQNNGTRFVLNASRYSGGAWSTPVQVDSPSATRDAQNAALVADAAGNVTAVWRQSSGGSNYVLNASRYSSGAWSVPVRIDSPSAISASSSAALVVDAAGNVTALWSQNNGTRNIINASRYGGGAWSAPTQVDSASATGDAQSPALAVDAAGSVTAAWSQNNGVRSVINASRFSGGSWSPAVEIDSPGATGSADRPTLAADAAGNVTAAWIQISGARAIFNASRYSSGNWSTPVQVDSPSATGGVDQTVLAADIAGNVTALWSQASGARVVINACRFSGGRWSTPVEVDSASATGTADGPLLAVDAAGNAVAAWSQVLGSSFVVNTNRLQ